jgi:hypothetical protein
MIQRNFRKLKARKEFKQRKLGLFAEEDLNLPEDTGRVKHHKEEL